MANQEKVRDKMIRLMDMLLKEVDQLVAKENQTPEELKALPALADSIVNITAHAVIERRDECN